MLCRSIFSSTSSRTEGHSNTQPLPVVPHQTTLEERLKQWAADETIEGDKEKAIALLLDAKQSGSHRLFLPNLGLTALPPGLQEFAAIYTLDISCNPLRSLPGEVYEMGGLRYLNLSDTQIERVSHRIAQLNELRVLNLKGSKVSSLPIALHKENMPHLVQVVPSSGEKLGADEIAELFGDRAKLNRILTFLCTELDGWGFEHGADFCSFLLRREVVWLADWLTRLKENSFMTLQDNIPSIMVELLTTAYESEEFRDELVAIIDHRTRKYVDQTGYLFNELYIAHKLHKVREVSSAAKQLQLLVPLAKTLKLRKELESQMRANGVLGLEETNTYFLQIEAELGVQPQIGLETAMRPPILRKLDTVEQIINISGVMQRVQDEFVNTLLDLPAFKDVMSREDKLAEKIYLLDQMHLKRRYEINKQLENYEINTMEAAAHKRQCKANFRKQVRAYLREQYGVMCHEPLIAPIELNLRLQYSVGFWPASSEEETKGTTPPEITHRERSHSLLQWSQSAEHSIVRPPASPSREAPLSSSSEDDFEEINLEFLHEERALPSDQLLAELAFLGLDQPVTR